MKTSEPLLWTCKEIAAATGGQAVGSFEARGVSIDSRTVGPGDLFVALEGPYFDGHDFISGAMGRGAAGAITARPVGTPHVRVGDTLAALRRLAAAARTRHRGRIIGVTGSVGKTGTKELLANALANFPGSRVHRSYASYNGTIGAPLSLARMPADSHYAVLEMGLSRAGEMRELTFQVRPHVAVVTAIAPAHLENFESVEAIADAKAEIFEGLQPEGVVVLPRDSPFFEQLAHTASLGRWRVITFGLGDGADVRAANVVASAEGSSFVAHLPGIELPVHVPDRGAHWVSNALAVLAAVHALRADVVAAAASLFEAQPAPGRGSRHAVRVAGGRAVVIDESYNANVASMRATLDALRGENAPRRLAVLGEMLELGHRSADLHVSLADAVAGANVDLVVAVGQGMAPLCEALREMLETVLVADVDAALRVLRGRLRPYDVVLVKGSHGVGLSRLVRALCEEDERA